MNDRRQRIEDALLLALVEHAGQQVAETRLRTPEAMYCQRYAASTSAWMCDVSAASSTRPQMALKYSASAVGLPLQHGVDAGHQRDQIVDGRIALARS